MLSLGGTVLSESVRIAGDEINESIVSYLKKAHNMVVGERTAEEIKIKIGSAFPDNDFDQTSYEVRGLHLLSGLPRSITLTSGEIREAMADPLSKIVEAIKRTFFTHVAEDPLLCVVNGCGEILDDFRKLKRVVDTPDFIRNAIRD